jgi:hypothetical protein
MHDRREQWKLENWQFSTHSMNRAWKLQTENDRMERTKGWKSYTRRKSEILGAELQNMPFTNDLHQDEGNSF